MTKKDWSQKEKKEQVSDLTELESNIEHAINDLIDESEYTSEVLSENVSSIITHLARTAASIRVKKQSML